MTTTTTTATTTTTTVFFFKNCPREKLKAGLWTILLQETAPDNSSTEAGVNK